MKNLMKRISGMIVTLALAMVFALCMTTGAGAETITYKNTDVKYILKDVTQTCGLNCGDAVKKSDVSNLKVTGNKKCCTKPKVVIEKFGDKTYMSVKIRLLKPGKVNISYSVKQSNGDINKYEYHFIFKKYTNPAASIKVGNKNYTSKFNKKSSIEEKAKNINGKKITVKTKKGYTLVGFSVYDGNEYKDYKNGAKISGLKKGSHVNMMIKDKDNGYNNVVIYIE